MSIRKMNINDYKKFNITFHADEGKFVGSFGPIMDDLAWGTINENYRGLLEQLDKEGFHGAFGVIVPTTQRMDKDYGKNVLGLDDEEILEKIYEVKAIGISFSKDFINNVIRPRYESLHKGRTNLEGILDEALTLRPYVEEIIGGVWKTPGFLLPEHQKEWEDIIYA